MVIINHEFNFYFDIVLLILHNFHSWIFDDVWINYLVWTLWSIILDHVILKALNFIVYNTILLCYSQFMKCLSFNNKLANTIWTYLMIHGSLEFEIIYTHNIYYVIIESVCLNFAELESFLV